MNKYNTMTDEKLIEKLHKGEDDIMDFILDKYKNTVKRKARAMFLIGGDTDDLIQEGMIGLYKAIRDFDVVKEVSFSSFADLCINRQIYTAINNSNRKKHGPLNTYVPFQSLEFDSNQQYSNNPEHILIDRENVSVIEKQLNQELSTFEKQVMVLYVEGIDYLTIAACMNRTPKSIDNAIQRIKTKASKIINQPEGDVVKL